MTRVVASPAVAARAASSDRVSRSRRASTSAATSRRDRTMTRTNVWRRISDFVTAVVDPALDAVDGGEDDGLGPSSPEVALATYLRVESAAQREAMVRGGALAAAPAARRIITNDDARDAAAVLKRDGAVFLKDVVPHDACDAVLGELNVICDSVKATYGDALRRTDVKLGFDGATRDLLLRACGRGGVNSIL